MLALGFAWTCLALQAAGGIRGTDIVDAEAAGVNTPLSSPFMALHAADSKHLRIHTSASTLRGKTVHRCFIRLKDLCS